MTLYDMRFAKNILKFAKCLFIPKYSKINVFPNIAKYPKIFHRKEKKRQRGISKVIEKSVN